MFFDVPQEKLRSYCRNCIESFEIWARRLIHEKMTERYGENYIDAKNNTGESIVKKDIRHHVHSLMDSEPTRFRRAVDTLFVDHIVYFLCNPKWYVDLFKCALDNFFPQGKEEVREYLTRLIPIRNSLSHSNPISIRQAEQAICYTHDFIEGLKAYYKAKGEERMWNVPSIIRATDSRGNEFVPQGSFILGPIFTPIPVFYVGEEYSIQIEVDPAFTPDSYSIHWLVNANERTEFLNMTQFHITFSTREVGENTLIICQIITNNEWHRHRRYDDAINIMMTVLPTH